MKPAVAWIGGIVLLLGLSVGAHLVLLGLALTDPSFAVEPDYERQADRWDEIVAEREASRRLGWTVELRTRPADEPGQVEVTLELHDAAGRPVRDASAQVATFHNARAAEVLRDRLPHVADGIYAATLPLGRSGVWEFRLRVVSGDDVYVSTLRRSVLSTPRFAEPSS